MRTYLIRTRGNIVLPPRHIVRRSPEQRVKLKKVTLNCARAFASPARGLNEAAVKPPRQADPHCLEGLCGRTLGGRRESRNRRVRTKFRSFWATLPRHKTAVPGTGI